MRGRSIVLMVLLLPLALLLSAFQGGKSDYYELSGSQELTRPDPAVYRQWVYAGSSVVPDDENSGKAIFPGIHQVYVDPDSYRAHQEKGAWPDSTIVVMEVFHIEQRETVGGFGYFTTGGQDILVQVKDRRVFPESGWAYYLFSDSDIKAGKTVASPEDARCGSCHVAAAEEDELFSQHYPALRKP